MFDTETAELLSKYTDVIGTLAYSNVIVSDASKNEKTAPEGCAIVTVSSHCTAHLLLKGITLILLGTLIIKFWLN